MSNRRVARGFQPSEASCSARLSAERSQAGHARRTKHLARIHRLSDDLANQIAAGEVVERPASVVKELVENAIDAGAQRVAIHTELGGKKHVRVEDDGEGMEPEDARLAIERHATSKIRRADDLAAIRTMGFRGEALPSIASVSHFVLRSRARGRQSGTEIRVNGGMVGSVVEIGAAEGTIVEVNDLFYNLPARRKFLKSDAAESAQVSRIVTQLALACPAVGFTLTSAGRVVLQCPPAASLRDRLYQLYGERTDLIEVRKEAGGLRLTGFIAALADTGPTRGPQNVFVNRRVIKDRTIAHAIIDSYSQASIKERSPEVHLFIEMAPDAVDVNVHPTKAEVRFRDQSLVHEVVRRALMDALGHSGVPLLQLRPEVETRIPAASTLPGVLTGGAYPNRWVPQEASRAPSTPGAESHSFSAISANAAVAVSVDIKPLIPLRQFRDTKLTAGRLESQGLLVPIVLDLAPSAHQALVNRARELERFGFELESFGAATVKITAVPALLRTEDCSKALLALAEDLEGLDRGAQVQDALQRIAATTACHAAVKANYPLTYEKMTHILDELRATAYSTVCPHGRPVMLRLTRREIEKNFDRI
ncbi:MAG: DNA mismatch repair endonuclease MutL [Acidobacteria bacterium]|nr:MAG: DNA mismatch repair endonuclease MutL [Acidobacteriota bacterium]